MTRKERREAAKKMGFLSKNSSFKDFAQRIERSNKAGDVIHKKNLENQRWETKKKDEQKKQESALREIQSRQQSTESQYTFDTSSFSFLNPEAGEDEQPQ